MTEPNRVEKNEAGFSLPELLIAMTVTLVLMAMAAGLLARCVNIRTGEDATTDSLADVQRALNIMSREVANAGFGISSNGVVGCAGGSCDSDASSIRVRSDLDGSGTTAQDGEDVKFLRNVADDTSYLVRYDANAATNKATVLANRIDAVQFHYFDRRVSYNTAQYNPASPAASLLTNVRSTSGAAAAEVTPNNAVYVVIVVAVRLDAVGTPNSDGYQGPRTQMLASDVALRNSALFAY